MKTVSSLTKRNVKLFFKDKGSFFTSSDKFFMSSVGIYGGFDTIISNLRFGKSLVMSPHRNSHLLETVLEMAFFLAIFRASLEISQRSIDEISSR